MSTFTYAFIGLLSLVNPLGTLPIFLGLTSDRTTRQQVETALWTAINTFVILAVSFLLGHYVLQFLGITLTGLKIAGGLIIASSGFALMKGNITKHKGIKSREKDEAYNQNQITLTPLAMPMLAGPGSISFLIALFDRSYGVLPLIYGVLALLGVCAVCFVVLASAPYLSRKLGANGLNALSRIVGFLVISIGVEFILSAMKSWIEGL